MDVKIYELKSFMLNFLNFQNEENSFNKTQLSIKNFSL